MQKKNNGNCFSNLQRLKIELYLTGTTGRMEVVS